MYGISGKELTKYTVIYDVYVRFWPTLSVGCFWSCMLLNPCCGYHWLVIIELSSI